MSTYTVTEADVTQHEAALSIQESQITGLNYYTDSDVDTHINVSGASSGQVLSYNGVDYAWIAAGGDLVNDTSPQLGGNLDVNGHAIFGTTVEIGTSSNGDIILNPNGTGNIELRQSYNERFVNLGSLSGTEVIDVSSGSHFYGNLQSTTTFVFSGETSTSNQVDSFTLYVFKQTSFSVSITWPTEVLWSGGTAPDVPATGETDIYVFTTICKYRKNRPLINSGL